MEGFFLRRFGCHPPEGSPVNPCIMDGVSLLLISYVSTFNARLQIETISRNITRTVQAERPRYCLVPHRGAMYIRRSGGEPAIAGAMSYSKGPGGVNYVDKNSFYLCDGVLGHQKKKKNKKKRRRGKYQK